MSSVPFTDREKSRYSFVLVEQDPVERGVVREALSSIGFTSVYQAVDYDNVLRIIKERSFSHMLFACKDPKLSSTGFLSQVLQIEPELIAIILTENPKAEEVFELLKIGARGFLVKPCNKEAVHGGIYQATNGQPFSRAILNARDRNEALCSLMASNLDRLATAKRQARNLTTTDVKIEQLSQNFRSSVSLARTFAQGGEDVLRRRITSFFISVAEGPATRLGRLRERLRSGRKDGQRALASKVKPIIPRSEDENGQ